MSVVFKSWDAWLRDGYICTNCISLPRQRHIQHILDTQFPSWNRAEIHESSPSNDFISRYCSSYSQSQFFPDTPPGNFSDGIRCENLEELTLSDSTFDIFITQDVFEHIFDPKLAAKEIMRVLKPNGFHIFTVPRYRGLVTSCARAKMGTDKSVQYLADPQYHGNPIGDGKSLVTWDYGSDFEHLYAKWTNSSVTTYVTRDRALGLDGEFLEVFVARK
jgi:SAM-dependent methyltransferase